MDGGSSVANYYLVGNVMRINHTEVPPAVGRRGIAAQIVRAAFDYADAQGLNVEPWCSYVRAYMKRHPDTQRLLSAEYRSSH